MVQTIEAVYDGAVFRPDAPMALQVNTRVRITVQTLSAEEIRRDQDDARLAAVLAADFDPQHDEAECHAVIEAELAGLEADGETVALEELRQQWGGAKAARQAKGRL